MVLEAALVLPLFLTFLLILQTLIRVAVVEAELQKAAGETVKVLAVHMAPVDTLYSEAKAKWNETKPAERLNRALEAVRETKGRIESAEDAAETLGSLLPDSIVSFLEWEKKRREQLERDGNAAATEWVHRSVDPIVNKAFLPVVLHYANRDKLDADRLTVREVRFPDFENHRSLDVGVTLQYDYKLPLPFFSITFHLQKTAVERAWIGV